MRAVRVHRFGEPEVMKVEEVEDPRAGEGQLVVTVHAAGVNPVDAYMRATGYGGKAALPFTPGSDGAGVVEAVGKGVTSRRPGERVYVAGSLSGTYAEKALCKDRQVHPLPPGIAFGQGAALGVPYGAAYRAIFQRGKAAAGEIVLVHGASGGVGIAAVQLARAAGMTVIGTAGSERGRELVLAQGAHHVLDHGAGDHLARAREISDGRGVDLILEMLANVNLGQDLGVLAPGGRVVVVGSRGRVEIDPRDLFAPEADIRGMTLFAATERERAGIHAALAAGLENGTLRPVVSREFTLEEAPAAHHAVMEGSTLGKLVLLPGGPE